MYGDSTKTGLGRPSQGGRLRISQFIDVHVMSTFEYLLPTEISSGNFS